MRNYWLILLASTLAAPCWSWGQDKVFIVKDKENGVVFTDRPETIQNSDSQSVERVELQQPNIAQPVEVRPPAPRDTASAEQEEAAKPKVVIASPANETTIAMGPGNFAVSATATPPLSAGERLTLLIDGTPYGSAQETGNWFVQGALRGPHDLVVRRGSSRGDVTAVSEPVRVYVLRPSILRR